MQCDCKKLYSNCQYSPKPNDSVQYCHKGQAKDENGNWVSKEGVYNVLPFYDKDIKTSEVSK